MTKSEFTPGPWIYSSTGPTMLGYSQPYAIAEKGKGNLIAGCFDDVQGGIDTALANARLISAAPELLAALEACLPSTMDGDACALGHAAIAKARGAA